MEPKLWLLLGLYWFLLGTCQCFSTQTNNAIWRTYILTDFEEEFEIGSCSESPPEDDRPDEDELELLYPTMRRHFNFCNNGYSSPSIDVMVRQTSFGCGKLGHQVWASSIALSLFLSGPYDYKVRGQSVLELGAGCGLPSAVCSDVLGARSVMATDFWMQPKSLN